MKRTVLPGFNNISLKYGTFLYMYVYKCPFVIRICYSIRLISIFRGQHSFHDFFDNFEKQKSYPIFFATLKVLNFHNTPHALRSINMYSPLYASVILASSTDFPAKSWVSNLHTYIYFHSLAQQQLQVHVYLQGMRECTYI